MNLYVGTSGYSYPKWKGTFYPRDLPLRQMLHYYGDHFRAVIVASPDADGPELPGFALYHDAKRQFCSAYGRQAGGFLIRPDGYIG